MRPTILLCTLAVLLASSVVHAAVPVTPGRVMFAAAQRALPAAGGARPPVKPATPPAASCDVLEFRAEKTGTPKVDPKLAPWKNEMKQDPLAVFDTFTVVGEDHLQLASGNSGTFKKVGQLNLWFKGTTQQDGKTRLQLEATVDGPTGKRVGKFVVTQDSGASQMWRAGKVEGAGGGDYWFVATCSNK